MDLSPSAIVVILFLLSYKKRKQRIEKRLLDTQRRGARLKTDVEKRTSLAQSYNHYASFFRIMSTTLDEPLERAHFHSMGTQKSETCIGHPESIVFFPPDQDQLDGLPRKLPDWLRNEASGIVVREVLTNNK